MVDKCLSKQKPGDGGNRTDEVLFSFPAPRSPGPAAPEGTGNKQNPEATQSFIMQGHCTVTRENPTAEIQARIPESEQGESDDGPSERTRIQCS